MYFIHCGWDACVSDRPIGGKVSEQTQASGCLASEGWCPSEHDQSNSSQKPVEYRIIRVHTQYRRVRTKMYVLDATSWGVLSILIFSIWACWWSSLSVGVLTKYVPGMYQVCSGMYHLQISMYWVCTGMYYAYTFMYLYIISMHCNQTSLSRSASGCWASGTSMFASRSTPQNPEAGLRKKIKGMNRYIHSTYVVCTLHSQVQEQYVRVCTQYKQGP